MQQNKLCCRKSTMLREWIGFCHFFFLTMGDIWLYFLFPKKTILFHVTSLWICNVPVPRHHFQCHLKPLHYSLTTNLSPGHFNNDLLAEPVVILQSGHSSPSLLGTRGEQETHLSDFTFKKRVEEFRIEAWKDYLWCQMLFVSCVFSLSLGNMVLFF